VAETDCRTRVTDVVVYDDPRLPADLGLDTPEVGSRWTGWSCAVTGSLRVRSPGRRIEGIQICTVSTVLDEIDPETAGGGDRVRFAALVSTFGLARHTELFLHVRLDGGELVTACRIDVECDIPPPPPCAFAPILINALPRSGTTWLASLLAQHPEVAIHSRYPFEVRQAVYWTSLLRTLASPYNNHRERREMRFLVHRHVMGGSPYYTNFLDDLVPWFATTYAEELTEFVRGSIDAFQRNLQALGGPAKAAARYFVEKFPGRVPPLTMRWIFPRVRELYLVRHPADVFRSIFRFNERRGYADFGEETLGRTEQLFRHVALENQENLMFFEQRCRGGDGVIVRYEDLAADAPRALSRLLAALDMDHSDRVIRSMIDAAAAMRVDDHVTSGPRSTERTPGLSAREEEWIAKYFAGFLTRFYPDERRS
jgi:hypothetical protein